MSGLFNASRLGYDCRAGQDSIDQPAPPTIEGYTMSRVIRCKMICHHVAPHPYSERLANVRFGAVWSASTGSAEDENAIFGELTPFGEFNLGMVKTVAEGLEINKAYYVDISLAE